MEWTGFLYDGQTADRRPVALTLDPPGLRIRLPDGSTQLWPIGELRQTQGRFSSEMLRIEFGTDPAQALLVEQPGFVEAMRRAYPGSNRSLRARGAAMRLAALCAILIVAGAVAYAWGAPAAADWLAPRVPPAWEVALGNGAATRLAPADRQCTDSVALADLRQLLDRLVAAAPKMPYDFTLVVVRDSVVNALAAPGGFIAVYTGLLRKAGSPEEVAGVLAHEIQHVTHRHSTRAMIREAPLRLALSSISSGTGLETAASVMTSLGSLRYRRGDEAEADRDGMRLLAAAQIEPAGMVTFMRSLDEGRPDVPRLANYLSSHPRTVERLSQLEAMAAEQNGPTRPVLDEAAWARVRGMCDR